MAKFFLLQPLFSLTLLFLPYASPAAELISCLGEICLRPIKANESFVVRKIGSGDVSVGGRLSNEGHTRCYYDAKSGRNIEMEFRRDYRGEVWLSGIFVSGNRTCKVETKRHLSLGGVKLISEIQLGEVTSGVLGKLGTPSRIDKLPALKDRDEGSKSLHGSLVQSDVRWVYFPEGEGSLLGWAVYFYQNSVTQVVMWDSP